MAEQPPWRGDAVVRRGTFLYAGEVVCHVRIVRSSTRFGSGDYEDPPEVRDDREEQCFYVEYTGSGTPDRFSNATVWFDTAEDAARFVSAWPGVGHTVRWTDAPATSD